jgi:CelD/BcsL family acetyltransferase involved in cellulose biosynthesis
MPFIVEMSHDIDDFAPAWPSLDHPGTSAHTVFQSADILKIWQRTIGAARRILPCYVRVATATDHTLLLLPLGIEDRRGVKVLVALDGGVSDYNAPIAFDGAEIIDPKRLHHYIRNALPNFDAAVLEKLPARIGAVHNPLAGEAAFASTSAFEIDLDSDWQTFTATHLHRPKDSRRKRRRLAELGDIRFVVARTEAERERLYAAFIDQKTQRYLEKNGLSGFERPGYRAYYAEMTRRLHARGFVHLSALEVGGSLVATHWGLVANQRFYCLMLAFADCQAARYSAASLLVEDLIRWSFENGVSSFDLGFGEAAWKLNFGARRQTLLQHEEAATPLGWAYLNARKLRNRVARTQLRSSAGVSTPGAAVSAPAEVA